MGRSDGGLRSVIHQHMKGVGDFQAIETGLIGGGVPDINYCINGAEGWIECKRTSGWSVGNMEGTQVAWAERRVRNGGRVFCAVRRLREQSKRLPACDELYLLPTSSMRLLTLGHRVDQLLAQGATLGVWVGGPAQWNWQKFAEFLQGRS